MSRVSTSNNRRSNVRSKRTSRRKSKNVTARNRLVMWRRRALNNASAMERLRNLERERDGIVQERDRLRIQLTNSKRELVREDRNYRNLLARANKQKNAVTKLARDRWREKERELKEKYEQRLAEMEMERERQEEERLEAEARVAELEDKVEELQGDLDNMYDSYY